MALGVPIFRHIRVSTFLEIVLEQKKSAHKAEFHHRLTYSQTCLKGSLKGRTKIDCLRQVTS